MKARMTAGNSAMAAIAAIGLASTFAASAAFASDVGWTITIGSPRPAPRVIYAPPPVVYQPPVVYYPAPVVVQPVYQPVVYAQPVQYVGRIPPGHLKKWHKHGYKYGYGYGHAYGHGYGHGKHDD